MVQDIRSGERLARSESVTGVLTLVVEPPVEGGGCAGILVRETPRLAARAVLFLEELVQLAGVAFASAGRRRRRGRAGRPPDPGSADQPSAPAIEASPAEIVLRSTDDLKKIVETVEREVIDRAMRRVEGNQSRGAQILNISRGSLIAKLKEFGVPDYRYMRRERGPPGLTLLGPAAGVDLRPDQQPPERERRGEAAGDLVEVKSSRPEVAREAPVVRLAPGAQPRGVDRLDLEDEGQRRGPPRGPRRASQKRRNRFGSSGCGTNAKSAASSTKLKCRSAAGSPGRGEAGGKSERSTRISPPAAESDVTAGLSKVRIRKPAVGGDRLLVGRREGEPESEPDREPGGHARRGAAVEPQPGAGRRLSGFRTAHALRRPRRPASAARATPRRGRGAR